MILDAKVDAKSQMSLLPELCDLNNCNNCLFFEARRHEDLYMWAVKAPNGPSIRFLVQNIHTMDELKMAGNCLKGSRGLLSFDAGFDQSEHLRLMKEVLTHVSQRRLHGEVKAEMLCTDIWSSIRGKKDKAIYRSHSQFLSSRQQDMVP